MKPCWDIFEALNIQSCNERTGAFSQHSDTRSAREMWVRLMHAKFSAACLWMMANLKRGQIKPFSQPTSHFSIESLEKLRQLFQAAWFQLLQVTSLPAVTTGRTWVKILVSFWPDHEHSLRSNLRAPNFRPKTPLPSNALALSHALINIWTYHTKIAPSGPDQNY